MAEILSYRGKAMSRLWDKEWFKYLCMCALTLAAIVVFAVATPQKQNNASAAKDNELQITSSDSADESDGFKIVEPEQEKCLSVEHTAAKWVDGEIKPMSDLEIAEFEEELYASKTKQEYKEVMENIAYYNKVIDMKRFDWYKSEYRSN